MSGFYLLIQRQPQHKAPLYKYAFCSLSNIMSSWCQYEALKYVSFPTQVVDVLLFPLLKFIVYSVENSNSVNKSSGIGKSV